LFCKKQQGQKGFGRQTNATLHPFSMKFGFDSKKRDKRTIQDGILILGLKLYSFSTPDLFFGK